MFGELPALMLVSWITGAGSGKTGGTYARNGQVNSTYDWCVDAVFFGELFVCFRVKNTKKWVRGLDKDLILKITCKTQT